MAGLATIEIRDELLTRKQRLHSAVLAAQDAAQVQKLLQDVDEALERIDAGTFGLCDVCHEPIESERLHSDPLIKRCLDHLTPDERNALERDLDLASRVQREMLPSQELNIPGWEVSFHYQPLGAVSGDYCDVVPLEPANDLLLLVGDVTGKGVAASMLMAGLRAIVRTLSSSRLSMNTLAQRANRLFCESTLPSHFATLALLRASESGELELCNAGHCPPLIAHHGEVMELPATGLPLGMFCESSYTVHTLTLSEGDGILLYTDGLTEARDGAGTEYGSERLKRLLADRHGHPRQWVDACLWDLRAFSAGQKLLDDLTVMAIRRTKAGTR